MNEPPTADLPTITVTPQGAVWAVLICTNDTRQPGILRFSTTLDAALDAAYAFVYTLAQSANTALPPLIRLPDPPPARAQARIALSDEAWSNLQADTRKYGYQGRASHLGVTKYLLALLKANPTPQHWYDDRAHDPDTLNEYDLERINNGQFPLWSRAATADTLRGHRDRHPRNMNAESFQQIITLLAPTAQHFLITSYRGSDRLNPRHNALAAIEAIGLHLLKPRNPPNLNPNPRKWVRTGHNRSNPSGLIF